MSGELNTTRTDDFDEESAGATPAPDTSDVYRLFGKGTAAGRALFNLYNKRITVPVPAPKQKSREQIERDKLRGTAMVACGRSASQGGQATVWLTVHCMYVLWTVTGGE